MELQTLADIAVIVEAAAFIVSVVFVWIQIRESNQLARVSNNSMSFRLSSPYLMQLFQDEKLAQLYFSGAKDYETLSDLDRFRFVQLIGWWLTLHDNVYYQYQNRLLDATMYQGWDLELDAFVQVQRLSLYWNEMKHFFRPEFQTLIDRKLQKR